MFRQRKVKTANALMISCALISLVTTTAKGLTRETRNLDVITVGKRVISCGRDEEILYYEKNCTIPHIAWEHYGNPGTYGGCYTIPVYSHKHYPSCYSYKAGVSFIDTKSATGVQPQAKYVLENEAFSLPSNTFINSGYDFVCWRGIRGIFGDYSVGDSVVVPKRNSVDIVFIAVWEPSINTKYTLEFYKEQVVG